MEERARFVRLARRRVSTEADAEDIVQQALLRAAERGASVDDPSRARAWFYRILRNTIVDHHRKSFTDFSRRDDADVDELSDDCIVDAPSACACATRLVERLRPNYADVIRRVDLDGEEPAAAAATLGISQGNLDVRLHRARKSLRAEVSAYCGVGSYRPCLDCACDDQHRCGSPP